jgi:hypothetical protein
MQRFKVLGLDINYASIFRVGCPVAYSKEFYFLTFSRWQFDDFQSTYQCKDAYNTVIFAVDN